MIYGDKKRLIIARGRTNPNEDAGDIAKAIGCHENYACIVLRMVKLPRPRGRRHGKLKQAEKSQ